MTDHVARAAELVRGLTLPQKIRLLSGDVPRWRVFKILEDLLIQYNFKPIPGGTSVHPDIPGIAFSDGPRGIAMNHSTCFPAAIGRGATWDPELEERVATAMGLEARALGANVVASVCINVLRHPAWGRAQETFGEDPFHLGEMGAAHVHGMQKNVMACVKHFACNSIENARFKVDVRIDDRTLHEIYLPHFKRCIDAGAACVMSAYNRVNGDYCGESHFLLTEILKKRWGFRGFVMSDFFLGLRDGPKGLNAGLDLEMPLTWRFGKHLLRAIRSGHVAEARIDDAAERIVSQQLRFSHGSAERPIAQSVVACPAHRQLAREVAEKSLVLLKNENDILPLDRKHIKKLAVIGRLADRANTGDKGSSKVRPPYVSTPLQGLSEAAPEITVSFDSGRDPQRAVALAKGNDAVILCVGNDHRDEGEYLFVAGGDRDRLTLSPSDERLIRAVAAANPRTAAVVFSGGAVVMDAWRGQIPAIVWAGYPGMEGGRALAAVLFGDVNPSGKLPCIFPVAQNSLPPFNKRATRIDYGYFHGQRLLDRNGETPAFYFGHGISYTSFRIEAPKLWNDSAAEQIAVSVTVENTGTRNGDEVVQIYASMPGSAVERPVRWLAGFLRLRLDPGERVEIKMHVPWQQLAYYDVACADWQLEPGRYVFWAGPSADPARLQSAELEFRPSGR